MSPEERETLKRLVDKTRREIANPCDECGEQCPPQKGKPRRFCSNKCCHRFHTRTTQRRYYAQRKSEGHRYTWVTEDEFRMLKELRKQAA